MRLTADEVAAIKDATWRVFGDNAVVRLFGSRTRDDLRGGDIDLMVEVDRLDDELRQKSMFEEDFWRMTEPRKVDLLVAVRGRAPGPFQRIAYRDGIIL